MKGRAALLAGALCVLNGASVAGLLTGNVLDASTSAPIPGAYVSVHILIPDSIGLYDTADVAGVYEIGNIPPGNEIYVVMAYAPGFKGYYFKFDKLGTGSFSFDVLLEPLSPPPPGGGDSTGVSGTIYGHSGAVTSLVSVAGATVELSSAGKKFTTVTGPLGRYQLLVPIGSYRVSVSAQEYESATSSGVSVGVAGLSYGAVLQASPTSVSGETNVPVSFALREAYPNPFNPATNISFVVPTESRISLSVYDLLGREVASLGDAVFPIGTHALRFEASGLTTGVYFVRMDARALHSGERFVGTRHLVLMR